MLPLHTFDGIEIFPSTIEKAARLGFGLVSNHCFYDGNKRIAAHAMLVFLELNHIKLNYTQNDLTTIFLKLANNQADYQDLLNRIKEHALE